MQTRTRNALVFAAGLSVLVGAVVWISQKRDPVRASVSALDAVPEGALLVGRAELEPLRRSGIAGPLLSEAREIPGLGKVADVCGFDPLDGLTEIVIAIPAAGDDGAFGLVAAGLINRDALVACATKVIEGRGGRPVVNTIGSFRTVRDASLAKSDAEIAVREGGPVLLGAGRYLRSMIDTSEGQIPSIRGDKGFTRLNNDVGRGAITVTVVFSEEQRRLLAEELSRSPSQSSPAASVVGLGLAVAVEEHVLLHGIVACDRAPACAELSNIFDKRRKAEADGLVVRLLGIGPALERLRIDAEGERVHGRVDLSKNEATNLLERLLVLRAAAAQKGEAEDKQFDDERSRRKRPPEAEVDVAPAPATSGSASQAKPKASAP